MTKMMSDDAICKRTDRTFLIVGIILSILYFLGGAIAYADDDALCDWLDPEDLLRVYHGGHNDTPVPDEEEMSPGARTRDPVLVKLVVCKPALQINPEDDPDDKVILDIETGQDNVKLWANANKTKELHAIDGEYTFPLNALHKTIWVDLFSEELITNVVGICARFQEECEDHVLIHAEDVELLVPNYDRNIAIDREDQARAANDETFYFWINDDDDKDSVEAENEPPGAFFADWKNDHVDSVRDLVDFFPVWVNIQNLLAIYPREEYSYTLKQEDGALNVIFLADGKINPHISRPEGFTPSEAGRYLTDPYRAKHFLGDASVIQITADGTSLSQRFLIASGGELNHSVILLEARKDTMNPLVLEIRNKADGALILRDEMPISIAGVEQMFRHKNLWPEPTVLDRETAPGWPDEVDDELQFVYIHGFKVNEEDMKASASEAFKRLWQSGFNGRFWAISWDGIAKTFKLPHFHNAVINAFAIAPRFAEFLTELDKNAPVDVVAHSLGNMLTSLAIVDYNAPVRNYYTLNAAVALEAYGDKTDTGQPDGLPLPTFEHLKGMISTEKFGITAPTEQYTWIDYAIQDEESGRIVSEELYASEWYRLFKDALDDERRRLTWRNRLQINTQKTTVYNFWSKTEEVLGLHPEPKALVQTMSEAGDSEGTYISYVWQLQELMKGVECVVGIAGCGACDPYAGWSFVHHSQTPPESSHAHFIPSPGTPVMDVEIITTPEIAKRRLGIDGERDEAFVELLKTDPLFRRNPKILFGAEGSQFVKGTVAKYREHLNYANDTIADVKIRDWLLAKAFPARTGPLGSRQNLAWGEDRRYNFNMNDWAIKAGDYWPRWVNGQRPVWHHSDYNDVPYLYVYPLYQTWVRISTQ